MAAQKAKANCYRLRAKPGQPLRSRPTKDANANIYLIKKLLNMFLEVSEVG